METMERAAGKPLVIASGGVRALNPAVPLGALWREGSLAAASPAPGTAEARCPVVETLRAADVEMIRAAGLGCYVWTVSEPGPRGPARRVVR